MLLSRVRLFVTPLTAARQAPLSFTVSWSLLRFTSITLAMLSNHLILCCPLLLCLQFFSALTSFPMNWLFASGGQNIGASALVLPMNIQDWFSLGLTGLKSLLSKGFSKESFPAPQFKNINSLALSLLYGPTLTSIHDYWKNHSFDYMDLYRQSDISAF